MLDDLLGLRTCQLRRLGAEYLEKIRWTKWRVIGWLLAVANDAPGLKYGFSAFDGR